MMILADGAFAKSMNGCRKDTCLAYSATAKCWSKGKVWFERELPYPNDLALLFILATSCKGIKLCPTCSKFVYHFSNRYNGGEPRPDLPGPPKAQNIKTEVLVPRPPASTPRLNCHGMFCKRGQVPSQMGSWSMYVAIQSHRISFTHRLDYQPVCLDLLSSCPFSALSSPRSCRQYANIGE